MNNSTGKCRAFALSLVLWASILGAAKPYRGHARDIETWDGSGADIFRELRLATHSAELEEKNKIVTTEISSLWAAGKSTNASFFLFFPPPPLLSLAILLFSEHAAFPAFNFLQGSSNHVSDLKYEDLQFHQVR